MACSKCAIYCIGNTIFDFPIGDEIVRERRAITPDTALRLARYFGTTPQFWLNLQNSYDLKIAEREIGSRIAKEVHARLVA